MKDKFKKAHMKAAFVYAELSYSKRKQVGCVIVKDDTVIALGYNGTPPGWPNACEGPDGNTLPEVIHAESNALGKVAASTLSCEGASMFVTYSPCLHCAKEIANAKIKEVYYAEEYRLTDGLDYLHKRGIKTYHTPLLVNSMQQNVVEVSWPGLLKYAKDLMVQQIRKISNK